jgi:hypothetical protein
MVLVDGLKIINFGDSHSPEHSDLDVMLGRNHPAEDVKPNDY